MIPTAGGQYHWVSVLAPPRFKRFLSYVTGMFDLAIVKVHAEPLAYE